jgi:hypothetical protein
MKYDISHFHFIIPESDIKNNTSKSIKRKKKRDSGLDVLQTVQVTAIDFRNESKYSSALRKSIETAKKDVPLDVQLMLFPNYTKEWYSQALSIIKNQIEVVGGKLKCEPFFLSDGTPLIRAELTPYQISVVAENSDIYTINETSFFSLSNNS